MGRTRGRVGLWILGLAAGLALEAPDVAHAQSRRGQRRAAPTGRGGVIGMIPDFPSTFNTPGGNFGFSGDPLSVPVSPATTAAASSGRFYSQSFAQRQHAAQVLSDPANWPAPAVPSAVWQRPSPKSAENQTHIAGLSSDVVGGSYTPGFGVDNGFAPGEYVWGGVYIPGYGVNNGFGGTYDVVGGTYVPGLGVVGSFDTSFGYPGVLKVQGGLLIPGYGVLASPNLGARTLN